MVLLNVHEWLGFGVRCAKELNDKEKFASVFLEELKPNDKNHLSSFVVIIKIEIFFFFYTQIVGYMKLIL